VTSIPLRRRLFVLTAAAILPLAAMAGLGLYALEQQQYVQAERVGLELARSVGNAVDAELRSSIAILETLATTPTLDRDDLVGFRERANRVISARPDWSAIVLTNPAARPLVDTRVPADLVLPDILEDETLGRVARTRTSLVGNLTGRSAADWVFTVAVPVFRGRDVRYVLTAVVKPEAVRALLARQRLPSDWVVSIMDANGLRVARSRAHEENLGGRLSASTQRVVDAGGAEGFGLSYTLEGESLPPTAVCRRPAGWRCWACRLPWSTPPRTGRWRCTAAAFSCH
jgi:hypothetical protein